MFTGFLLWHPDCNVGGMQLLTLGNPKTDKGRKLGYLTGVLHLAPSDLSGVDVCPYASDGCRAACLNTAGRGGIIKKGDTSNAIQDARVRRTKWFMSDRKAFTAALYKDIAALERKAKREGLTPCVRLNGTSDLAWHSVCNDFPHIQFYDYSKNIQRAVRYAEGKLPPNLHITFSKAEDNDDRVTLALLSGVNVAVVFRKELPATYRGKRVVSGDESDLRFLDPADVIVGLKAKGKALQDDSGFVV